MPSASVSFFPIPTAGTTEGTANFSIPADEYGYVQMSVSASAASDTRNTSNDSVGASANGSAQGGGQWLDEGDSVSTSASAASSLLVGANVRPSATSTASFLINGTTVKQASCTMAISTGASASGRGQVIGTAAASYSISRFDK